MLFEEEKKLRRNFINRIKPKEIAVRKRKKKKKQRPHALTDNISHRSAE